MMELKGAINNKFGSVYQLFANTEILDFTKVERELGFIIHSDLKEYYASYFFNKIEGVIASSQVPLTEKWGNWFEFNEVDELEITLQGLKKSEDLNEHIMHSFRAWTGDYDFGQRFWIGSIYTNIGTILVLFNNQTGVIEWIDPEYGYFGNLEEDPNGKLTDSLVDLIRLMKIEP